MSIRRLLPVVLGLGALWGPHAAGQTDPCTRRTLPLTVVDATGRPIANLTASDLQGKFRGQSVKILSVAPDNRPHRIVILLDASGSMATKWREVVAPAYHLTEIRLPNTKLGLLIFGEKINEQIDFSAGQNAVAERLSQIRSDPTYSGKFVQGKTALFDALLAGVRLLSAPTSADVIYLVSDGGENGSRAGFDEVVRQLTLSGVRLFVSGLFGELGYRSRTPEELNGPTNLAEMVKRTGGEMMVPFANGFPTKPKEAGQLTEAMNLFYLKMIQNHLLEVELPTIVDKQRGWELKLTSEKKQQWKNARILYPSDLIPCEP